MNIKIICSNNYGYSENLTVGKSYEALDVEMSFSNFTIYDDRGVPISVPRDRFYSV